MKGRLTDFVDAKQREGEGGRKREMRITSKKTWREREKKKPTF